MSECLAECLFESKKNYNFPFSQLSEFKKIVFVGRRDDGLGVKAEQRCAKVVRK